MLTIPLLVGEEELCGEVEDLIPAKLPLYYLDTTNPIAHICLG
jgi:hypothetical protein